MAETTNNKTLTELLADAGAPITDTPCTNLVPVMNGVEVYADGDSYLATWQGTVAVSGPTTVLKVLILRTKVLSATPLWVLIVDLAIGWDGGMLPLVDIGTGKLNLDHVQVIYLSDPVVKGDIKKVNDAITAFGAKFPLQLPAPAGQGDTQLAGGFTSAVTFDVLGKLQQTLLVSGRRGSSWELPETPLYDYVSSEMELDQPVGPLRLYQISVALQGCELQVTLKAKLTWAALTVNLEGLGVSVALNGTAKVTGVIAGGSIAYVKPPVTFVAALAYQDLAGMDVALTGMLRLELKDGPASGAKVLLALLGAVFWGRGEGGWTSFFAYGELRWDGAGEGATGVGPLVVTGVAAGFGANSTVRLPATDNVGKFPLVAQLSADLSDPAKSPMQVLNELSGQNGWVQPAQGQYWLAGGLQFTVFNFIATTALLLGEFGAAGWQVLLAGRTTVDLPKVKVEGKDPIARLIIDFALSYSSALNRFAMDVAVAKGSYVLDKNFALTGGLSLYVWGSDIPDKGITAGVVFTAGGYHPQFNAPANFPKPPRLGFTWASGQITFRGESYVAVTGSAFMAGTSLSAVWDGGYGIELKAWFSARVDALVQWKPFYVDVSIGIWAGVSATIWVLWFRVPVSIELGVGLQLWTPPLGGRATFKLWFISFTIDFGAGRQGAPPVPWDEFQVQVPAPIRLPVPEGAVLQDVHPVETRARADAGAPVLVSAEGFTAVTESAVPATEVSLNGKTIATASGVSIRPMKLKDLTSVHKVTLTKDGTAYDAILFGWDVTAIRSPLARALWGDPLDDPQQALNEQPMVKDCLTGLRLRVPVPQQGPRLGPVLASVLGTSVLPTGKMPLRDGSVAGSPPAAGVPETITVIADGIASSDTVTERNKLLSGLQQLGVGPDADTSSPLAAYAKLADRIFTDPPMTTAQ